jgi:hypothetical protein
MLFYVNAAHPFVVNARERFASNLFRNKCGLLTVGATVQKTAEKQQTFAKEFCEFLHNYVKR